MAVDKKQLQLKTGEDKVKDLRRKLNAATSNREYQALLEQIAADEMANSVLADEILEALETIATPFRRTSPRRRRRWRPPKRRPRRSAPRWPGRSRRCGPTWPGSRPSCGNPRPPCPPTSASCTSRIVRQKGEDALAVVENQYCGGCNQQVPLNLCSQIMLGQPVACKTCGRLLYLPE